MWTNDDEILFLFNLDMVLRTVFLHLTISDGRNNHNWDWRTQILLLSGVLAAVASSDLKVPNFKMLVLSLFLPRKLPITIKKKKNTI